MTMTMRERLETAIVEDKDRGIYGCRRDIFTDPEIFDLEISTIFEKNCVFLAHESRIPGVNEYFTTWIGRQPVVISREKTGELNALINACAHRDATLYRRRQGYMGSFTCPFHG